jgi:tetratricopeptide (TPR) repeat protein
MATFNSEYGCIAKWRWKFAGAIFLFAAAGAILADDAQDKIFAGRAAVEFYRAQKQFHSNTNNSEAAWQFARTCFDFASFAMDKTRRAAIANQGITACRQLIARDTNAVAAHYYLGMNLGQLARTRSLGALKIIWEMESEFKTAAVLDKQFDYAGPERNLGLLYRDAPGWPVSVGSRRSARDFLERAVVLAPDYPENLLNLAESYLKWNEREDSKQELNALDALWPTAQKYFTGEKWEQSWDDWSIRRTAARKRLEEISISAKPSKNLH